MAVCTPVTLSGQLTINGAGGCSPCGTTSSNKILNFALGCGSGVYAAVVSTDLPIQINASGVFIDIPLFEQLGDIQLFYAMTSSPLTWRIGAAAAVSTGTAGTFPTGFSGGEVLDLTVDGTAISTTFLAGDDSAGDVALRINAAAALASVAAVATVNTGGQLVITGFATGSDGSVVVTASATATTLGLSGTAVGGGEDVTTNGLALMEFGSANAVSRIQVSGLATQVELLAGGASA